MDIVDVLRSDLAEKKYKRVNVPLGKPTYCDPVLREQKFGIPTKSSESIATVMNLSHLSHCSDEVHQMYRRSHNDYGVGEKVMPHKLCVNKQMKNTFFSD